MSDENINKGYRDFVIAMSMLFPVVINSVKIIGNLILFIFVLLGIYLFIKEKKSPFKIPELKLFSWLMLSYFIVMLISIVQNEGFISELYHLGRKAHFLLAPFIALAIYRVSINIEKLLSSIKLGLILIGTILLSQVVMGYSERVSGMYNANIFGDIVLTFLFFSIMNFTNEKPHEKLLTIIAAIAGLYAIFLSGNRGTILMLVILSIFYLYIIYKRNPGIRTINKLITVLIFIVAIGAIIIHPNTQFGIDSAVSNIVNWRDNYNYNTSVGLRIEMWLGSIEAFKESPLLGHGYRNANTVVSAYVNPEVQREVFNFTHLHNEYITNLISAGIIGLISVLTLLLIPLRYFLIGFKKDPTCLYSNLGLILCVSYAGNGMTHIAFGEEHVNAVYVFFMALLLPLVLKKQKMC